jgi:glycosyltransferase involved in cell wall biosynthesis
MAVADATEPTLRILVLAKDFRWHGGVVGFIATLFRSVSPRTQLQHFVIGRRYGWNRLLTGPLTALLDATRLAWRARGDRYALIHLNPSLNGPALIRDGLLLLAVRATSKARILVFFHGWSNHTCMQLLRNKVVRNLFVRVFGTADRVIVLAEQFKSSLMTMGFDGERVNVMTTMFDGRELANNAVGRVWNGGCVLFLSRLEAAKGVYQTLEAFQQLLTKHQEVRLIIAGTGSEESSAKAWTERRGLTSNIEFVGYVRGRAKSAIFRQADIFLLPTSWGEGCPVSLLEAMAAGLPVVTTSVGGISSVIRDVDNGVILRTTQPEDIAVALSRLISDPAESLRIGERNRVQAWSNYEAAVVTSQIEVMYHQIVGAKRNV